MSYRVEQYSTQFGDWNTELIGGKSENTFDSREAAEAAMESLLELDYLEGAELRIIEVDD